MDCVRVDADARRVEMRHAPSEVVHVAALLLATEPSRRRSTHEPEQRQVAQPHPQEVEGQAGLDAQIRLPVVCAARIASTSIDQAFRLRVDLADLRDEADAGRPYSLVTLERWADENLTAAYVAFRKELGPLLLSLPLILRGRGRVFAAIRSHLASAPAIALRPMLEVTAALAVDLRQEFYPEFGALLACLVQLLRPTEVEQLEDVFSTLCYLFKYLLRQLLADLPAAFAAYRPLLAHATAHVREFAAESFAYLLRRLPAHALPRALRAAVLSHVGAGSAGARRGDRAPPLPRGARRRRAPALADARPPPRAPPRGAAGSVRPRRRARRRAARCALRGGGAHGRTHAPRPRR